MFGLMTVAASQKTWLWNVLLY